MTWNTALVTGASSGIGRCMAQQLAATGSNLVLAARSRDELDQLALELTDAHGVSVEVLAVDLTDQGGVDRVVRRIRNTAKPIDLVVNNAGAGTIGKLADLPAEREAEIVRLNVLAVLQLSRAAAETMKRRGSGTILNMTSLAAYAPIPYFAVYGATKAFVLSLTLALREELRGSGVSVTAIAPGFVDTDFGDKAGVRNPPLRWLYADPEKVAREGLKGAARGRAVVLPGLTVLAGSVVSQLGPPSLLARMAAAGTRRLAGAAVQRATSNATAAPAGPPPDQTIVVDDSQRAIRG